MVAYQRFSQWVQIDVAKDRQQANRKMQGVLLWCLILPAFLSLLSFLNRKFALTGLEQYSDSLVFLPAWIYASIALWPTLRDIPRVFRKGGFTAMLEDSEREVSWREQTAQSLNRDLKLGAEEWTTVAFHLEQELDRLKHQNRYMSILVGAVLFLLFQFLDLGATTEGPQILPAGQALIKFWVDQFSQWILQLFSLGLFTSLYYLSGAQFHQTLKRYLTCVNRIRTD